MAQMLQTKANISTQMFWFNDLVIAKRTLYVNKRRTNHFFKYLMIKV